MGRIPKVEKERALQLQRAGKSCCVTAAQPQDPTSGGRPLAHHRDATLNGGSASGTTTVSTNFLVTGGGGSCVGRRRDQVTAATNGTVSETASSRQPVGSRDSLRVGCSGDSVNGGEAVNSATKPLHHHRNVDGGATPNAKLSQVQLTSSAFF